MALPVAGYAAGILIIWILTLAILHILSPLRSIPGPFVARFTKLWFLFRVWRGRFEKENIRLHQRYGKIIRYGPQHYSFSDPEAVKIIYGKGTEFDKSSWYEAWNAPGFKTLFTEPSVKVHSQVRRKFQSTYSMSSMVTYEAFADHCIALLCSRLEEIAKADGKTDLSKWMLFYAADTVSMITYSKRMGFLDAGEDIGGFFKNLHGNLFYSSLVGIYSGLHPLIFNTTAWLSRLKLTDGTPRMFIARFTSHLIAEKRKECASIQKPHSFNSQGDDNDTPKDFLSKFLDFNERDSSRFTEHDINIGLIGNVVAGSDTTASALSGALYCLLKNPSTLSKLREEISLSVQSGELSTPPTFKEVHSLPYLQAVIQEAMRLHPPVGLPLQRVVPPSGAEICGFYFPAGTVVGVNPGVMHLKTSVFGGDVAVFRPERWLEADKETHSNMQRNWMAFGLGTRTCIGKHISMLEMTKLIPELVRRFDFELSDELKGEKEMDWVNHWFVQPVYFPVKVRLRQQE